MKKIIILPFLFFTSFIFSQEEASNWYFGGGAGVKFFPDGSVTALTDGKLVTNEGSASWSNATGDLLFYTNGITVWNKNHKVMQNGTDLMGNKSTTQSATIVPKPGSTTLYYVFTLDAERGVNGFRYSIIDISLDGGLGGITNEKNVLIYTPSDEKIAIVKHKNGVDFWVITHGVNSNTFYSYLLSSVGLSATPVASNSGIIIPGTTDIWGYMKISPDGTKLAMAHVGLGCQLFDFDTATGMVFNPEIIYTDPGAYGLEFSPNSKVLYVSNFDPSPSPFVLMQYDLTANPISGVTLVNFVPNAAFALQLGPNGKIYIAAVQTLGVINNPNSVGAACNIEMGAVPLLGNFAKLGLPQFYLDTFFKTSFTTENLCVGNNTKFTPSTNLTDITAATWDFGDGNTSTEINPEHTYALPNTYQVSLLVESSTGKNTETQNIVISQIPVATRPQDLLVCDTNNDGLYNFDLTKQNTAILNGQDPTLYTVKYFANATDYASNAPIISPNSYVNTVTYQEQSIIAEVSNNTNTSCKSTTSFLIDVFDAPKPSMVVPKISFCDNSSIGTDADGKVIFDLTQNASVILNGQLPSQFILSYYKDVALTQKISKPTAYANANATETMYVKMFNIDHPSCSASTSFEIQVFAFPVVTATVDLKQCDDDIDGFSIFNLEEAILKITTNALTETVVFFRTKIDAQNNVNPITNPTSYTNQTVSNDAVYVRVSNANGCFRISKLKLIVSTTQIPLNFAKTFTVCDDAVLGTNTDGISTFNFSSVTQQIQAIFPAGQLLDVTYYCNLNDALSEKNAISDSSNYRNIGYPNTQKIYIRVDSRLNNDCLGLGGHITLNVASIPIVKSIVETHCDDDQDGKYAFDTSTIQTRLLNGLTNVTVTYFDQNDNPLSSPLPNPFVTATQTLKVIVTSNSPTACSYDTTVQFIVDDLPEAFAVSTSLTTACDDEVDPSLQDGKVAFDTSVFQNTILGGQTGMIVKYFEANNNLLSSPLPNPFVSATQNVRVEVINPKNATCVATLTLPFVVNKVPNINLSGEELVCSNLSTFTKIIDAGIQDGSPIGNFNYVWSFNGSIIPNEPSYSLSINKAGIYTVEVANNQGCYRTRTIKVSASDIAQITDVKIVDLASSNSISIWVSGAGDYVYGLDEESGYYQSENIFTNVSAGIHTVFIKDLNGCGVISKQVAVLGIPNFFTPNGDGYNDYWNIKGVDASFNVKKAIHIFDRFGKLISQISPLDQGWDGTYNGHQMPASDYWYSIQLEDGKIVNGHFSLKR